MAKLGFIRAIPVLLKHNADINALNKKHQTPLDTVWLNPNGLTKKTIIELGGESGNNFVE